MSYICITIHYLLSSTNGKGSACNAGDLGSIPGSERSPGEGNGNPLQYSCLENSMDRPWGRKESGTTERWTHTHTHYHCNINIFYSWKTIWEKHGWDEERDNYVFHWFFIKCVLLTKFLLIIRAATVKTSMHCSLILFPLTTKEHNDRTWQNKHALWIQYLFTVVTMLLLPKILIHSANIK